jgi:hypothetical protein
MYIEYIDLPNIPEELLESYTDILNKPSLLINNYSGNSIPSFVESIQRKEVSNNLIEWLQTVLEFPVRAQYLILSTTAPIHKDPKSRPQAYNYIINAGGDNVVTTIYSDNFTALKALVIPEKTWHCLDTGRFHSIQGISKDQYRIVLSIDYTGGNIFNVST